MEATDFTESFLKEILEQNVLASISGDLVAFFESYVTGFFSYALIKFLTNLLKNTC